MYKLFIILATVMLNLFLTFPALGQDSKMLTGIVLNDAKQPVSDVTINIPGSKPVYTNKDGVFNIERVNNNEWLFITPLEKYSNKKILLTNQDSITIYLTRKDIKSPFAEVLTPLKNKTNRDIISSYTVLDPTVFENNAYSSTEQYLQGSVAGALVTQTSGMPGSGATVYLRGYSSILSNNQPLYIVDGVPFEDNTIYNGILEGPNYSPLSTIDPLDISGITILKDAAATALYGAKGANGVVLINTLEPKETKTTISFLYRTGLSLAPGQLPQLDNKAYKTLANEMLFSSGIPEEVYKEEYPGLFYTSDDKEFIRYNHNTNWQDQVFKNAITNNVRFSIKGGDAIAKYGLSVGFLKNNGIIKNTSYDRINIRLVGAFDIFKWLKMDVSSSLSTSNSLLEESGLSSVTSPLLSALWKSPLLNPYEYDDAGNRLYTIIDETDELGTSNPTAIVTLSEARSKNYRFITSVNLTGEITENLKFASLLGLNSNNTKEFLFIPNRGFDLLLEDEAFNESKGQNSSLFTIYNDNRIFFDKTMNEVHDLYAVIGLRWQTNKYDQDFGIARNTASDYFTNLNRGENLLNSIGGYNKAWNWGALYANISYSFADKYLLSATLSSDISSRIGNNAANTLTINNIPVGIFYSFAGAWRISNEKFFPKIDGLEELKLRASYGIAGNDDIGETNSYSHYIVSQYRNTSVLIPGGLANNELSFQTKGQFNIGLDFSFLANRMNMSLNYFNNNSNNVLIMERQNSYLGYDTYPNNAASFSTNGFEAEAFARVISKKEFTLDFGLSFSSFKTIVNEITGGQQIYDIADMQVINREGERINSFYGYRYKGVYESAQQASDANMYNFRKIQYGAGDVIYENVADANGDFDNIIDKNDKKIIGSFEPDFFGGFFINSRYKNFSLNMFFQGMYGNDVYNYVRRQNESMTGLEHQSVKVLQRWQNDGQKPSIPKATWGDPMGNNDFSDRWIEDGSYLRLKNLTIAYDVKQRVMGLSNLKVFLTASNLFTLSKYLGYDPEFSYSQNIAAQGVDFGNMPIGKQFMLGIKVGL